MDSSAFSLLLHNAKMQVVLATQAAVDSINDLGPLHGVLMSSGPKDARWRLELFAAMENSIGRDEAGAFYASSDHTIGLFRPLMDHILVKLTNGMAANIFQQMQQAQDMLRSSLFGIAMQIDSGLYSYRPDVLPATAALEAMARHLDDPRRLKWFRGC